VGKIRQNQIKKGEIHDKK